MKSARQQAAVSGFTIIEMIVVLGVTSLILLALFAVYDWHSKMYNYEEAVIRVAQSSRLASDSLHALVSQSYRVLASGTVNGAAYTSGAATVVLELPSIDSSDNVISGKWDTAVIYQNGSSLMEALQPDPASSRQQVQKLLSDSVFSLTFSYDNADFTQVKKVTVDLQNQLTVRAQTVQHHIQQDMFLQNYY